MKINIKVVNIVLIIFVVAIAALVVLGFRNYSSLETRHFQKTIHDLQADNDNLKQKLRTPIIMPVDANHDQIIFNKILLAGVVKDKKNLEKQQTVCMSIWQPKKAEKFFAVHNSSDTHFSFLVKKDPALANKTVYIGLYVRLKDRWAAISSM